jgi:hypothetical protein
MANQFGGEVPSPTASSGVLDNLLSSINTEVRADA